MVEVEAPMRASISSGAEPARVSMAWCSDIQKRWKPRDSTCCASETEFCRACDAVEPLDTGDWSEHGEADGLRHTSLDEAWRYADANAPLALRRSATDRSWATEVAIRSAGLIDLGEGRVARERDADAGARAGRREAHRGEDVGGALPRRTGRRCRRRRRGR